MNLFDYTDYRKFLDDFYREQKSRHRYFTVRYIAEKVGFKSASFFSQVVRGRSNISPEMTARFADFLNLKSRQRDYFETLVQYNQAKSHEEKKRWFRKLSSFRQSGIRMVDAALYEYYDKWYYSAIRELLYIMPFRGDYSALAKMLLPPISADDARKAIDKLLGWKFIVRHTDGTLRRSDTVSTTTGPHARSLFINNYQRAVMDLAKEAIDTHRREERGFSTLTLTLSPRTYESIQADIYDFRRRILDMAERDMDENRVYQLNIQFFPISHIVENIQ